MDDYQYGGGAGMVMTIQPIADCIEKLTSERTYDELIYMTPDGDLLEQSTCNTLSLSQNILILCGHYKVLINELEIYLSPKKFPLDRMYYQVVNLVQPYW